MRTDSAEVSPACTGAQKTAARLDSGFSRNDGKMEIIETHAHLCDPQFDADRADVIARARASGISAIVEIADGPSDWDKALALARAHSGYIRCALGLHPYYAGDFSDDMAERLCKAAAHESVAALGEIGLDYVKSEAPQDVQRRAFEGLLNAANSLGKPPVIHCRGAYGDLAPILRNFYAGRKKPEGFRGVIHCFSAGEAEALALAELGFALGVDGPATYPKNDVLRRAFRAVGPNVLVLETDSPYLPPQSRRGKRNEPACLPEIAVKLAEALGIELESVARQTSMNARRLFSIG